MLPQWMKMAKDPNSVGAQFLNVFGLEFGDVQTYLDNSLSNRFIDTVDLEQIDVIHKVPLSLAVITDLEETDEVLGYRNESAVPFDVVESLKDFYMADAEKNTAIFDRDQGMLYIRSSKVALERSLTAPYDHIDINGAAHYEYYIHHVWNALDEFGLLLGVDRLYGERNAAYKERILDVFRKPSNSTKQGLENGLVRELGLQDGDVVINEFANKAFRQSLLDENGAPSKKLENYVDRINKVLGFTWDNMTWGEAYWRSVEESQIGLEYLPHVWDVGLENWKDEDFQSGVGDGNELLVTAPKEESDTRNFKAFVGLRGIQRNTEMLNPEIHFKYKVTAKGKIYSEEYKPELYKYTVIASEIIPINYLIRAIRQFYYTSIINFDTAAVSGIGYQYDTPGSPGVEIINSNTILTKDTDRYLKLRAYLAKDSTAAKNVTPKLAKIGVKWEDTAGTQSTFWLDSQADLTRNDATVDTELTDINVSTAGDVELGFGDFYYKIDSRGSWEEGEAENGGIEFTNNGSIKLKLPKI